MGFSKDFAPPPPQSAPNAPRQQRPCRFLSLLPHPEPGSQNLPCVQLAVDLLALFSIVECAHQLGGGSGGNRPPGRASFGFSSFISFLPSLPFLTPEPHDVHPSSEALSVPLCSFCPHCFSGSVAWKACIPVASQLPPLLMYLGCRELQGKSPQLVSLVPPTIHDLDSPQTILGHSL